MGTHQSTTHHHREKWAVSKERAPPPCTDCEHSKARVARTNNVYFNLVLLSAYCNSGDNWLRVMVMHGSSEMEKVCHCTGVRSPALVPRLSPLIERKFSDPIPGWLVPVLPGAVTMQIAGRVSSLLHPSSAQPGDHARGLQLWHRCIYVALIFNIRSFQYMLPQLKTLFGH